MLPLLILVVPPTLAGGGYVSWQAGRKLVLALEQQQHRAAPPPSSSFAAYAAGMLAAVGTYGLSEYVLSRQERLASSGRGSGAAASKVNQQLPKQKKGGFVPPQSIGELLNRAGPPVIMRLGAASAALVCAGAVQTMVAQSTQRREK